MLFAVSLRSLAQHIAIHCYIIAALEMNVYLSFYSKLSVSFGNLFRVIPTEYPKYDIIIF